MTTVSLVALIGKCAWIVMIAGLIVVFIRRKRTGQWKRPWTFPLAMTMLGLALVAYSAALVLEYFGK
jgi:hypothetical protein